MSSFESFNLHLLVCSRRIALTHLVSLISCCRRKRHLSSEQFPGRATQAIRSDREHVHLREPSWDDAVSVADPSPTRSTGPTERGRLQAGYRSRIRVLAWIQHSFRLSVDNLHGGRRENRPGSPLWEGEKSEGNGDVTREHSKSVLPLARQDGGYPGVCYLLRR